MVSSMLSSLDLQCMLLWHVIPRAQGQLALNTQLWTVYLCML